MHTIMNGVIGKLIGQEPQNQQVFVVGWINGQANLGGVWNRQGGGGGAGAANAPSFKVTVVTTTTSNQTRSGTLKLKLFHQPLLNHWVTVLLMYQLFLICVTVVYCLLVLISNQVPNLYGFFDNISVNKYIARANKFTLSSNNLGYITQSGNPETVNVTNTATSTPLTQQHLLFAHQIEKHLY
jgi:hypothetical protein